VLSSTSPGSVLFLPVSISIRNDEPLTMGLAVLDGLLKTWCKTQFNFILVSLSPWIHFTFV
jgi:hypothetical protein